MNWDAYYAAGKAPDTPSAFAQAVEPLLKRGAYVLDVGCGNGRDTSYFEQMGHEPLGFDGSKAAILGSVAPHRVYEGDAIQQLSAFAYSDAIYMRWFLHAAPPLVQDAILKLASCSLIPGGILAIEARSANGEHPDDHARWPVDPEVLEEKLERLGMTVEMLAESTDFSPVGEDRPLLLRCLARLQTEDRRLVADGAALVQGGSAIAPARPPYLKGL